MHNGHKFIPVLVNENMIGHRFGEFSPTRTFQGHAGDKKAKRAEAMSKPSAPRRVAENEAMAVARVLRSSPRKLNWWRPASAASIAPRRSPA